MKNKSQTKKIFNPLLIALILFSIVLVYAFPTFVEVTTPTGTTSNSSVLIEYNITELNLKEVIWSWNETNFTIFDDNLILAYNFNNLSALGENDANVFDISGNGNNGTVVGATFNSTARTNGNYDGAFEFDGVNDYITTNFNASDGFVGLSTGWTISVWAKREGWANAGEDVFTKGYTQRIYMNTNNRVTFLAREQGGDEPTITSATDSIVNGEWNHLLFKWDGVSTITGYLNGEIIGTDSLTQMKIDDATDNSSDYTMGIGRAGFYFNGSMDEVRVWNKSFTDNEVKQIYYSNLKQFDSDSWSLYINESVPTPTQTTNYFSCAIDSSNNENCTSTRTINTGWTINITTNFTSYIGDIATRFYGANTHVDMQPNRLVDTDDDGILDSQIDYVWQREQWLDANMDNQRGDMYLSSFYDGQGNLGFEIWLNESDCEVVCGIGCDNQAHDWKLGYSENGNSTISRNTDSHSGLYSMNISNKEGNVFIYEDVSLIAGRTYNLSAWVKTSEIINFGIQDISDWTFCNNTLQAGSGNWELVSVICTPTTNQLHRLPIQIGSNKEFLIDDWSFTEDGVEKSWWMIDGKNLTGQKDLVEWAYNNNQKILYITIGIPTFLQDVNKSLCYDTSTSSFSGSCKPDFSNSFWFDILDDFINQITNNGDWIDSIEIEVHNEPYLSNWNGLLGTDHITKATEYVIHYNETYNHLKSSFPTLEVGGPSGFWNAPNMTRTFLSNASSMGYGWDFISIHPYASGSYISEDRLNKSVDLIYQYCTEFSVDCPRIILSEWNIAQSDPKLNDTTFGTEIAFALQSILNTYPANLTSQLYQWNEQQRYTNTVNYPEHPDRWTMVTEPQLQVPSDPAYKLSYNTTKSFATSHQPLSTVYQSSSDNNDVKTITSKRETVYSTTIINTDSESVNITLNQYPAERLHNLNTAEVLTLSSTNSELGLIDGYEILYLGSGVYGEKDNFYFDKDSNLVTEVDGTNNIQLTNTHTSNQDVRIYDLTNALIYFSNNSVGGNTNINSNDGNINITLTPNNASYVLDNFNLTEGTTRTNSPLNITNKLTTSDSVTYYINNTLDDAITISFISTSPCPTSITQNSTVLSFSCTSPPTITTTLNSGLNTIILNYPSGGQIGGGSDTPSLDDPLEDEIEEDPEEDEKITLEDIKEAIKEVLEDPKKIKEWDIYKLIMDNLLAWIILLTIVVYVICKYYDKKRR